MINTNEVIERRNEKLYNKLSDLIDKKILETQEKEASDTIEGFSFELLSNTPVVVIDMLINAYRTNGWYVNYNKGDYRVKPSLYFSVVSFNSFRDESVLNKFGTVTDYKDFIVLTSAKEEFNIKNINDVNEASVTKKKIAKFDENFLLTELKKEKDKSIFTYKSTFLMALHDAMSTLRFPTKMWISHKMYYEICSEVLGKEFVDECTQRDILLCGLYGHIENLDIHVFSHLDHPDFINDIYIFDQFTNPLQIQKEEITIQKEDSYILKYEIALTNKPTFAHIHIYR